MGPMGQPLGFLWWRGPACLYPSIQAFEQRGVRARHLFVNEKSHLADEQCSTFMTSQTFLGDAEGKGALLRWLLLPYECFYGGTWMPTTFLHMRLDGAYGLVEVAHGADFIPAGFHVSAFVTAACGAFPLACSASLHAVPSQTRGESTSSSARAESRREPGSSQRDGRIQVDALEVGALAHRGAWLGTKASEHLTGTCISVCSSDSPASFSSFCTIKN